LHIQSELDSESSPLEKKINRQHQMLLSIDGL